VRLGERVDYVLSRSLDQLRQEGWQRSKRGWRTHTSGIAAAVVAEPAPGGALWFNVDFGVAFGSTKLRHPVESFYNDRLESLVKPPAPYWDVTSEGGLDALADDVAKAWKEHGAPWIAAAFEGPLVLRDYVLSDAREINRRHGLRLSAEFGDSSTARAVARTIVSEALHAPPDEGFAVGFDSAAFYWAPIAGYELTRTEWIAALATFDEAVEHLRGGWGAELCAGAFPEVAELQEKVRARLADT
jgi:hypothetical protein